MAEKIRGDKGGPKLSIIPAGAVTDPRISPQTLRLLALLGRHANRKGWCRRSQTKMAAELCRSRSSIQRAIDGALSAGYLKIRLGDRRGCDSSPNKHPFASHHYQLIYDPAEAIHQEIAINEEPPVLTPSGHEVCSHARAPLIERSLTNESTEVVPGQSTQSVSDPLAQLHGTIEKLKREIGEEKFEAWFKDATFLQGPPWQIIIIEKYKFIWIVEKLADRIRRIFGDDVQVRHAACD